ITALLFVGLMVLIELTGNYCFFNLLTIALSILLVDDKILLAAWHYVCGQDLEPLLLHSAPRWLNGVAVVLAVLIGFLSLAPMLRLFRYEINWSNPLVNVFAFFEPFRLVSSYGLFSVMTIERPEIVVEGSLDGRTWLAYEFKWKPGELN